MKKYIHTNIHMYVQAYIQEIHTANPQVRLPMTKIGTSGQGFTLQRFYIHSQFYTKKSFIIILYMNFVFEQNNHGLYIDIHNSHNL